MRIGLALYAPIVFALPQSAALAQTAPMPVLEHQFEGLVTDAFMSPDGTNLWTVEDGGRIRYRKPNGQWEYQSTPDQAQSTLRAIYFLPDPTTGWAVQSSLEGWAVGDDGRVLHTADGGLGWFLAGHYQIANPLVQGAYEGLRDVQFIDSMTGWMLGLHGIWKTTSGGTSVPSWSPVVLLDQQGATLDMTDVELYALDILECPGSEPVIVACGEPGVVLRSVPGTNGATLRVIWNIYDHCDGPSFVPNCSNGAVEPMMGLPFYDLICRGEARFEPWDLEFQRNPSNCGNALLVMVGGIGVQMGIAFSSTDKGVTWTRECHECEVTPALCANNYDYAIDRGNHQHYARHQTFKTLYGVAMFPDTTAVGAGYNGQQVVRQQNGVWVDRSQFCPFPLEASSDASLFALNGAVCERSPGSSMNNGKALVVGQGGQARGTTAAFATPTPPAGQPAENWTEELKAGWWRMSATAFVSDQMGWRTGQLYHIARTINGGLNWTKERIDPFGNAHELSSIAMSPGADEFGGSGVAVGTFDERDLSISAEGSNYPRKPKILVRVVNQGGLHWIEPTTVYYSGTGRVAEYQTLWDVTYAGTSGMNDVYWACGTRGIVLRTTDSGITWFQAPEPPNVPPGTFDNTNFVATAFLNQDEGIFVGSNTSTSNATAFAVKVTGPGAINWTDIAPPGVSALHDVAIHGTTAYAVGTVQTAAGPRGRVFASVQSGGTFGTFAPITLQPDGTAEGIAPWTIGDALDHPPVARIAVTPSGQVWIGGQCGRAWRQLSSGAWEEAKSQTDAHVLNMTPTPGGYVYLTCFRMNLTGPSLVRWKP